MMQLVVFAVVLAVVFAVKAAAIARTKDNLVSMDTQFSWVAVRGADVESAAEASVEPEPVHVAVRRAGFAM